MNPPIQTIDYHHYPRHFGNFPGKSFLIAGLLMAFSLPLRATLLFEDSFTSSPGSLLGTLPAEGGMWSSNSPETDKIQIISGSLTAPEGMLPSIGNRIAWGGMGEDDKSSFGSQTSGTVYYSFLLKLNSNTASTSGINVISLSGAGGNLAASLAIRKDAGDASKFNVGFFSRQTSNGPLFTSVPLAVGTTHLVVISYQFVAGVNNDIIRLWLDPGSFGGAEPAPTLQLVNTSGDIADLNSIYLWQRSSSTPNMELDELAVATTWAEAVPQGDGWPDKPDAGNTGVPAGTTLTSMTGTTLTITTAGTVLENKILSKVIVHANNVTIRNCRISGNPYCIQIDSGYTGTLIEDCELYGASSAAILGGNFTARRLNIHDTGADGIKPTGNVVVEQCYIHHLGTLEGAHADGVQVTGGSNFLFRYNNIDMPIGLTGYRANANFQFTSPFPTGNFVIDKNWLNGGNYTINSAGSYCTITNNRFGRNYRYGLKSGTPALWSGNVWDDNGSPAP